MVSVMTCEGFPAQPPSEEGPDAAVRMGSLELDPKGFHGESQL